MHTILLFINQYSHVTAQYSPIIFLYIKFSVKQHKEPGENILTHSVLLFLVSLIPPHFPCIDCDQPCFSLFFELCVGQMNPGTFGVALTSHCSGLSESYLLLSASILDSSSALQSSLLSFGLSKLPFQMSQISGSEMLPGGPSSSLSAGWWWIIFITQSFST